MRKAVFFLILPLVYVLLNAEYINEPKIFASCVIFVLVDFLMSYGLSFLYVLLKGHKNVRAIGMVTLFLVLFDQGLKVLVSKFQIQLNIIGEYLQIQERKNIHQFAGLNFLNVHLNHYAVVGIKVALILILFVVVMKCFKRSVEDMRVALLLMVAAITSLLDSVMWGYTLDYVYFYKFICYDLKDFYVDAALGLIVMKQGLAIWNSKNRLS